MNIKLPAEFDDVDVEGEPYEVECAGCGITLMCDDANLEEGDRWECWPCAEKFDAEEKAEREARRAAPPKLPNPMTIIELQAIAKAAEELIDAIREGGVGFYHTDDFWYAYDELCRSLGKEAVRLADATLAEEARARAET